MSTNQDRSTDPVRIAAGTRRDQVEGSELRRAGRARVKDSQLLNAPAGRRVRLTGQIQHSEIRIQRGGVAMLSAMCSREYLADLRHARRLGRHPSVDDPTRTA